MKNKKLYLIPYAHLDTQWRWSFATTIKYYLKATLLENFSLFEKYPGYCFNFTGAIRYDMIREYYPEEYEIMKEYIKKERWKIAGSCLDETDAIVPSPESLVRNILYGNQFNRREYGVESYDYMLPDCFGFPASFPTVLSHCGIKGFSTQKLTWGSAVGIPFSIGMWKGPDGSRLPAAFNPGSYITKLFVSPASSRKWLKRINENGAKYDVWKEYRYYGTGDIGGAPMELSVKNAEKSLNKKKSIICQDSADRFFRELSPDEINRLPEYCGDLLLTEHSTGSLTSQAIMKRWNRRNEFLADAAERASVAAWITGGQNYPYESLLKAWTRVIGSQMHDILPGTCTPDAYTFSYNDEVVALNIFTSILGHAAETMSENLDTRCEGIPLVIYNPLAFEREDLVEAVIPAGKDEKICLYDPEGERIPLQLISSDTETSHVIFPAKTPSLSWNVYEIRREKAAPVTGEDISVVETDNGCILENRFYRVRINNDGFVDSIFDKLQEIEILEETVHYELQRETPGYFPAWNMDWKDRKKKPVPLTGTLESIRITEPGPVRASVEITRSFKNSTFVQKVSLSAGSTGSRVEFTEKIDWHLSGYSLKTAFPLKLKNPEATYNWQVGKVTRNNNHEKKYEVPSHMWFSLTDSSGNHGVTILEDSKYGSDKPDNGRLRLTLLYTPARHWYSPAFRDQASQDWGRHTIRYALYSHRGDWRKGKSDIQGLRFNQPLYPFIATSSPGALGKRFSLLQISSEETHVSAVKLSEEDRNTMILRMIELTGGESDSIRLNFSGKIAEVWEVNGQEMKTGTMDLHGNELTTKLSPFQIRSFAVKPATPVPAGSTGEIQSLDFPCNAKMFSRNGENPGLDFSYPEEELPESIESGSIIFRLNKGKENDCLACGGQKLPLNDTSYNRISLLVSAKNDTRTEFFFEGKQTVPVEATIPSATGFVGQYDTRIWKRKNPWKKRDYFWWTPCTGVAPGYIKREEIAFFTTHIHSQGDDLPYRFGYMFRIDLNIPEGAEHLKLPGDPGVKIFSATLSRRKAAAENCRFLTDDFDI